MIETIILESQLWREDFEAYLMIAASAILNANIMAIVFSSTSKAEMIDRLVCGQR